MGDLVRNPAELSAEIVESLVLDGDLGCMSPAQRVAYYVHRCRMLGIDPGEQPFQLIKLNGKLVLYATKTCANALTRINLLSVEIKSTRIEDTLVIVEARASDPSGRFADDVGVLDIKEEGRLGKSNAIMKCATKAKRRAVLALVGLGVLDESEVEDIRGAQRVHVDTSTGELESASGVIDVEEVADPVGHRCTPELAVDLDHQIGLLAEHYGIDKGKAWGGVLAKVAIDRVKYNGTLRGPATLTTADAALASAWLGGKLNEIESEVEQVDDSPSGDLVQTTATAIDRSTTGDSQRTR